MKFSFHSNHSSQFCLETLNSISGNILSSGKIFDGKVKEDKFSFNYTLPYRDTSGIYQTKKLPHCMVSGKITQEGRGALIEGAVTIAKDRVLVISIIFVVVLIPVTLFLHSKNAPLSLLFYVLFGYVIFYIVEFVRYYNSRNEALEEFKKLLL